MKRILRRAAAFCLGLILTAGLLCPGGAGENPAWRFTVKAEAAVAKPQNCRFVKWNNLNFTSAQIAWDSVTGADAYQVRCVWTDGTHNAGGYVSSYCNGVNLPGLNAKHVYQVTVRAVRVGTGGRKNVYGAWSNIAFITPWPVSVSAQVLKTSQIRLTWNVICGSSGYNVFLSSDPSKTWYWNSSTETKASAAGAVISSFRGDRIRKYKNYYVRVITRRRRNGVFCTVPSPVGNYYQYLISLR